MAGAERGADHRPHDRELAAGRDVIERQVPAQAAHDGPVPNAACPLDTPTRGDNYFAAMPEHPEIGASLRRDVPVAAQQQCSPR